MTSAISNRQPAAAIIAALKAAITGVLLPDNATAAFQRVEFFDCEKLTEAFQFLLISEQRVCVIVPLDEKFTPVLKNSLLMVTRRLPVALLISDRVLGSNKRNVALLGDDTTPGAMGLAELALPAVAGVLINSAAGLSGVLSIPSGSSVMTISDKDQKQLPGRICVCLELEITGGTVTAKLQTTDNPGPIV